ncbi:MAG TPA: hypothetical protein VFZ00_05935, partial [Solirubrobacter sp.]|nr:hypothetical protein [Solirubrobacter sp.]
MAALVRELLGLSEQAQTVARGAAVAGDPFDPAIAAAAAGVPEPDALLARDELLAADLVQPTAGSRRFAFRHPLDRRAVYESTPGGWRLRAHARAAETLAAAGAGAVELAHHVDRAARPGDIAAADVLVAAAEQTAMRAPATAADWYGAALRLLPDNAPRRAALLREQARALVSAGRAAEARDVLRRAVDLLPASAQRVDVVVKLAELEATWTHRPDDALRRLERERALTPGHEAALTLAMAAARAEAGDHAAGEALADQARAEAHDPALEAAAAVAAADSALCRLRGDDAAALAAVDARIAEGDRLARTLSDEELSGRLDLLLSLVVQRLVIGDSPAALDAAERGLALARSHGHGVLASAFLCARGFVEQELGRLEEAEVDVDEALESASVSGNTEVGYWAHVQSSWLSLMRGDVDAALEHGRQAWDLLGASPSSQAGFTVADARLAAGDPDGALVALEAFGWLRPELGPLDRLRAADVAVRLLVALGRFDEAAGWARQIPGEAGGRRVGLAGAIVARAQATALLAGGDPMSAARAALAGVEVGRAASVPIWAARCRTVAGEALVVAGRSQAARREL